MLIPSTGRDPACAAIRFSGPLDDPAFVMIDLDFDTAGQAADFLTSMRRVWASPQAAPALGGVPRASVVQTVETVSL